MTLPRKLMIDGEQTVTTTRTHVKVLFVPFLILLAVGAAGGFLAARVGVGAPRWVVIAIAVVLAILGAVIPFLRWFLWTYTLTNKRIVEQKGILTRTGRVIPLSRINDVASRRTSTTASLAAAPSSSTMPASRRASSCATSRTSRPFTAPSRAWSTRRTGRVMNRSESREELRDELARLILGADPGLTVEEVATQGGVSRERGERLWRALGFPDLGDSPLYGESDVEALSIVAATLDRGCSTRRRCSA